MLHLLAYIIARLIICRQLFPNVGGGKSLDSRNDLDSSTGSEDVFVADDGLDGVVAAFDQDVGLQGANKFKRRVLFEEHDCVDRSKSGHDASALPFRHDGTGGALQPADRS